MIGTGLEDILAKLNSTVEERITITVKEAMEQYSPTKESANAVGDLSSSVAQLKTDVAALTNQFKQVNDKIKEAPQPNVNKETQSQQILPWLRRWP